MPPQMALAVPFRCAEKYCNRRSNTDIERRLKGVQRVLTESVEDNARRARVRHNFSLPFFHVVRNEMVAILESHMERPQLNGLRRRTGAWSTWQAATALFTIFVLLACATSSAASGRRARLSSGLTAHVNSGSSAPVNLIVSGPQERIDWLVRRHGLRVKKILSSGAVLTASRAAMIALADDDEIEDLSGDPMVRSHMAVATATAGADAAWAGNYGTNDQNQQIYGSIAFPAISPYAITVGAIRTQGTGDKSDDEVAPWSSKGPTLMADIIKPDLVAPGSESLDLANVDADRIKTVMTVSRRMTFTPEDGALNGQSIIWGNSANGQDSIIWGNSIISAVRIVLVAINQEISSVLSVVYLKERPRDVLCAVDAIGMHSGGVTGLTVQLGSKVTG